MFIEVNFKKVGQRYIEKPVKLNLSTVEVIEFDEKQMIFIDGKLDHDGYKKINSARSSSDREKRPFQHERLLTKIVTFKKSGNKTAYRQQMNIASIFLLKRKMNTKDSNHFLMNRHSISMLHLPKKLEPGLNHIF